MAMIMYISLFITGLQYAFHGVSCIFIEFVYNCIQLPESEADPDGSGTIRTGKPEDQDCIQL